MYGGSFPGFSATAAETHHVQQMQRSPEHQLDQRHLEHRRLEHQQLRQQQTLTASSPQSPTTTESLLRLVSIMDQMMQQQQQFFLAMATGKPYTPPFVPPVPEDASRRPFLMHSDGSEHGHHEFYCGDLETPTTEKLHAECTVQREEYAVNDGPTAPQQQFDTAVDITVLGNPLSSRTSGPNLRPPSISTNPAANITALLSMETFCFFSTSSPEKAAKGGRGVCSGELNASKPSPRTMSSREQWACFLACFEKPRHPAQRVPKPPDKHDQHTRIYRSWRLHIYTDRTENGPVTSSSLAKPEPLPLDRQQDAPITSPFRSSHRISYVIHIINLGLHHQRVAINVDLQPASSSHSSRIQRVIARSPGSVLRI